MRLTTFAARGQIRLGVEAGEWIIDLNRAGQLRAARGGASSAAQAAALLPPSINDFLAGGEEAMGFARDAAEQVRGALGSTRDLLRLQQEGVVWLLKEVRRLPPMSNQVDFEGELVAVIGRGGSGIPESQALDHVAGYTIFNDISIRDFQRHSSHWMLAKNFDHSGPLGPALVTRDEIPDPQALTLTVDVSGERMQEAHTGAMIFSVAHLIAYVSQALTLQAGDLIATGTPSGVGGARKPPRWLRAGDTVRVSITGLGVLETRIAAR